MRVALTLLLVIIVGGMVYVRLAPSDPVRWNRMTPPIDAASGRGLLPAGTDAVQEGVGGARASLTLFDTSPEQALARLDAVALATPRTTRLAGSAEAGMITWITRSAIFGFPDYTTAAARAEGPVTVLALHARQRFGRKDFGVNAARLRDWIARLTDG